MRKFLLSLILCLLPSLAIAQCNGVFSANQVCGSVAGGLPGPVASTSFPPGSLIVGTTTITSGTSNGLLYNNTGVLGNLATGNNGVLITSGGGVPSISTTLPSALTIPSPTLSGTIGGNLTWSGTQTFNAALTYGGITLSNSVTGTGSMVLGTSPALTTPTLGVAKATTLTAGDGCTTDRSVGSQIWTCRALSTNSSTHDYSASDTITYTASSLGHATYDDQVICSGSSGAINPNHCFSYQSFITWSGAGTISTLGFANFAPQVTAGTVTQLVFSNCQDVTISGGASVGTYDCFNCPGLTAATTSRCFFSGASTPVEFRGHSIRSINSPTVSSGCGTSPSIIGDDTTGQITMGTGSPTSCVLNFSTAFVSAPMCTVTWLANPLAAQNYTTSATQLTINQTATSSNKVAWHCDAQGGG